MARCALKFQFWPEADRLMWERLVKVGGLLTDAGPGSKWADETKRVIARSYGYWLSFLLSTDKDILKESPAARVTPERVRQYCLSMADVSARTTLGRVTHLHTLMRFADGKRDFRWLAEMQRFFERLANQEGPVRRKHGRLVSTGRLVDAGLALAQSALLNPILLQRAEQFRDGLMIALLALRPLRIKNFAGLRLGHSLIETSTGYMLSIPGCETKTGSPIELTVPVDLCPLLSEYLAFHRPHLAGPAFSDHVWLTAAGAPYLTTNLSQRIAMLTLRHVGVAISAHLFRDCAATTIATDMPEHVMIIAPLLGHTSLKTSEDHYNHAQGLSAGRKYRAAIRGVRASLARPRRRVRRPKLI
jgi:integrase/recombinase XerD